MGGPTPPHEGPKRLYFRFYGALNMHTVFSSKPLGHCGCFHDTGRASYKPRSAVGHGKKIKRGNMYHFGNFKIVVFGGGMILKLRVRTF